MRIVIGTVALAYPGGTESYCLTVAGELERLGHRVTLFADELGPLAERVAASGIEVTASPAELPAACDAVLANDAITAGVLADRFPGARLVYCLHSVLFDVQVPPLAPGVVDAIVAPSERLAAYARSLATEAPIVRLTQLIDTARFAPSRTPRRPARKALLLSHYLEGPRRDALVGAWSAAGLECVQVGHGGQVAYDVADAIADADIVVGKARAALEGMACGKAVFVFDEFGGDGWVTPGSYPAMEADNFAGLATGPVDAGALAVALDGYDPDMGWVNRELAVTHHSARSHVHLLVDVLRGPASQRRDSTSAALAIARATRSARQAQRNVSSLEGQLSELRARVQELEREAESAHAAGREAHRASKHSRADADRALADAEKAEAAAAAAEAECVAWHARALEAERQLRQALDLMGTRRVRAGLALGRSADRVFGRH